jgi:hypothetical protein
MHTVLLPATPFTCCGKVNLAALHSNVGSIKVRAFQRGSSAQASAGTERKSLAAESQLTGTSATSISGPRSPAFIPTSVDPTSLEHLLAIPALTPLFISGLILIHNKRPAADQLVSLAVNALSGVAKFGQVQGSGSRIDDLLPKPRAQASRAQRRPVLIFDANGSVDDTERLVAAHATVRPRKGLWVRCHLNSLRATTLRQFDALFMFDMAADDLDRLRSVVRVPARVGERLRDSVSDDGSGTEGVFVLLTADSIAGSQLPRMHRNPSVIRMRNADPSLRVETFPTG